MLDIKKQFIFNEKYPCFEGNINWLGDDISVILDIDEVDNKDKTFELLQKMYDNQKEWDSKLRKFAAEALTEDANDWLESDDSEDKPSEITEEEFAKRIKIDAITIYQNGDFEVFCCDDDMFWGHCIDIMANISGEIESADIAG